MDELDELARRSSATVKARAERIADTENALRDARSGSSPATTRSLASKTWIRVAIAAAAVGIIVTGAVVVLTRDDRRTVVSPTPSTEPATPDTEAPTTLPDTTTTEPAATSTTVLAEPPLNAVELRHGLTVSGLPSFPTAVRHVDAMPSYTSDATAEYTATMWFGDESIIRLVLGSDTSLYPNRRPFDIGDREGWLAGGDPNSEVSAAVGVRLDDQTWLRLESVLSWNASSSRYEGTRLGHDTLRAIIETTTFEPAGDDRVRSVVNQSATLPPAFCEDDPQVSGGGPDMVLALCDGTFAIYSGATGELIELIEQYDDPRIPVEEGPGPNTVDGIGPTPDGSTIYYSTGPEPVVGNLLRFVRGSGVEPELTGYGYGPSVSPDGLLVATVALDGIAIAATSNGPAGTSSFVGTTFSLPPMYPQPPLRWSPDSTRLAFEAGGGAIGVLDVTTGDVELYAADEPGRWLVDPAFAPDGSLLANTYCCDDQAQVDTAVVGDPGNHPPAIVGPTSLPANAEWVFTADGEPIPLRDGALGPADAPWARGVIAAALLPSG